MERTLETCDIEKCVNSSRHYRREDAIQLEEIGDKSLTFYVSIMDSLHVYLYHLFQLGLRTRGDSFETTEEKSEHQVAEKKDKDVFKSFAIFKGNSKFNLTAGNFIHFVFYPLALVKLNHRINGINTRSQSIFRRYDFVFDGKQNIVRCDCTIKAIH